MFLSHGIPKKKSMVVGQNHLLLKRFEKENKNIRKRSITHQQQKKDFGDYLKKYEHVSAICRLSESDERKFIESRNREMGEITGAREKRLAYLDLLAKAQAAAADAEIAEEAGEMEKFFFFFFSNSNIDLRDFFFNRAKELRNQSFGPMEVKMKAPDQTGSRLFFFFLIFLIIFDCLNYFIIDTRMIFFLKNLVPRAVAEISSGAAFGVLCKYNRPNKDQMQVCFHSFFFFFFFFF